MMGDSVKYVCDACAGEGVKLWRGVHGCKDANGYALLCAACLAPGVVVDDKGKADHGMPAVNTDQLCGWLPAVPTGNTYWGYTSVPITPLRWWLELPTYGATPASIESARHPATSEMTCPRCKEVRSENDFTHSTSGACRQCEHADFADVHFAASVACVEANPFEALTLWAENEQSGRVKWEQISRGSTEPVGEFGGMPVNISITWARLNGHVVTFYEPCSLVVHHGMIEDFLKKKMGDRWEHDNAMNFHNTIAHIERLGRVAS